MAEKYRRTIEELTGRHVLAFLSQAHVEPDITMEIFFVDGPLEGFGAVEITRDPNRKPDHASGQNDWRPGRRSSGRNLLISPRRPWPLYGPAPEARLCPCGVSSQLAGRPLTRVIFARTAVPLRGHEPRLGLPLNTEQVRGHKVAAMFWSVHPPTRE